MIQKLERGLKQLKYVIQGDTCVIHGDTCGYGWYTNHMGSKRIASKGDTGDKCRYSRPEITWQRSWRGVLKMLKGVIQGDTCVIHGDTWGYG